MARSTALPASAWLVGASSGIGEALARALAQQGCHVVISARRIDACDRIATDHPGNIHVVPLDVTDPEACLEAADRVDALLGGAPELVVFAAGVYQLVSAQHFESDVFRRLNAVNYLGAVNLLAAVLPPCVARRKGHIAVVASVAGYRGLPRAAAYGATKAALINLCESLAPELGEHGVRLRLVNPGFVATPMTAANDFPMPFLLSAEDAAERLLTALTGSSRFEITFPKRFTWWLKVLRLAPYAGFIPVMRWMARRRKRSG
ncbi:MAG: SDR family NAD(P)-dependent oxidoreductase [Alphaproteobacteria bacterium]